MERLEWYTDVLPAYRGEEQRRCLRSAPRQIFEFAVSVAGDNRRYFENVLWKRGAQLFAVPLWFEAMELTATLSAGASAIALNPAMRQFAVGDFVMLIGDDPRAAEVLTISALSTSISLSSATTASWPAGTRVLPARAAYIDGDLQLPRFTGEVSSVQLRFECVDPAEYTADAGAISYRSFPVLEETVDWSSEPQLALERKLSVFDGGVGPVVVTDVSGIPMPQQTGRYTLSDRAALDAWRKRLYALRGKQGSIWVPSGTSDLTVAADIGSSATTIDVRWAGYTDYLLGDPTRKDLRIVLRNGTVLYRRITGATEISASVERLTIDAALGVAVAAADVVLVSYLTLMRNVSDAAEFAYWTGDIADTALSLKGFRHVL